MVKADELSFLCNWPQFMMAQDGHTAQADIQALNILSPGPQSSLMPMVFFILVFTASVHGSAGYYMSSTYFLLTLTSLCFLLIAHSFNLHR